MLSTIIFMQNICQKELHRHLDKLRNGSHMVKLVPIDVGVVDYFKVDNTIISFPMGADIAKYHTIEQPAVIEDITLINGKVVKAWVTRYVMS